MNTTLNPPPTDREREMLAEWVGRLSVVQLPNGYLSMGKETIFDYAEELFTEFRNRYGVTGAEPEVNEPTHIYEVMFLDELTDKEERISVHLSEKTAREMQDMAREKLYRESSYFPDGRDDFEEDFTFFVRTTPILP